MANNEKITNPSYWKVELMLREHEGDASELRRMYPNFDPEAEAKHGRPYLHHACWRNHFHAVRGLLQCGASLLRKDDGGWTALFWASFCGKKEGSVDLVAWLLSENSDTRATVNWGTDNAWTPLHIAAYTGSTTIVCMLLSHGGDITLKNTEGRTALDLARDRETIKVLETAETYLKKHIEIGEWRPQKHSEFSRFYQKAMETLVVLAKAESN